MKLQTVNVIETNTSDVIMGITSFSDDEQGNREAEAHFLAVIGENGADVKDADNVTYLLDEGYFEANGYQATIIHS